MLARRVIALRVEADPEARQQLAAGLLDLELLYELTVPDYAADFRAGIGQAGCARMLMLPDSTLRAVISR